MKKPQKRIHFSDSSEFRIRPPENNTFDEQSPLCAENSVFSETNSKFDEENRLTESIDMQADNAAEKRKEKKNNLLKQILRTAFHGGAAALTVLVITSALSSAGNDYGKNVEKMNEILEPFRDSAFSKQTSNMGSLKGLWNSDPDAPHDYDSGIKSKEGSCLEAAEYTYTCRKCGITKTVESEAGGHKPGETKTENRIEPDCENDGFYENVVYCSVCGIELSREKVTIPSAGEHKQGEPITENKVEPTCTSEGSYESVIYCSACGKELSREVITLDILPHTEGDPVTENTVKASCTEAGTHDEVIYCADCSTELSRETVTDSNALGHTYKKYINAWNTQQIEFNEDDPESWFCIAVCDRCGEPAISISFSKSTQKVTATVSSEFISEMKKMGAQYFSWILQLDYEGDTAGIDELEYTGRTATFRVSPDWDSDKVRVSLEAYNDDGTFYFNTMSRAVTIR